MPQETMALEIETTLPTASSEGTTPDVAAVKPGAPTVASFEESFQSSSFPFISEAKFPRRFLLSFFIGDLLNLVIS